MSQYLENPISSQSRHCFICNTETVNVNLNSHRRNLCERFCILVGRYLNFTTKNSSKSSNFKLDFKKTLSNNSTGNDLEIFCCCESCFVEVEIFCVVYEQYSLIQLELNASLNKFVELIKNKNSLNEQNKAVHTRTDFVDKFRNAVVSHVQKGGRNFPRLQLTNLKRDLPTKTENEPVQSQLPQEVSDDVIIKEEATGTAWRPSPKPNSNDPLPFKCRICGKGFAQRRYRRGHENRHVNPYYCRFCGRRFTYKVTLDLHEKIHTGGASTTQFMCFVCKKSFLRINDCKMHITKVHNKVGKILKIMKKPKSDTGAKLPLPSSNVNAGDSVDKPKVQEKDANEDKPFKCPICGKGFCQKSSQIRHQVIHNKARPYRCQYCGKGYKHNHILQSHKLTHFGIRPFQCGLCGVKFTRSSHCRAHQKNVHGVTNGVIIKESVTIPNNTENSTSSSATILEGLLLHPNDNAATAAEGEDQHGHKNINSIKENIGGYAVNLPTVVSTTDGVEVELSETHLHLPKSEPFELELDDFGRMELKADLCDPFADV